MAVSRTTLGSVIPITGRGRRSAARAGGGAVAAGSAAVDPEVDGPEPDIGDPAVDEPAIEDWPDDLASLYRERRTALVRVAYLLTSDAGAAEEIVQDAVIAVRARWDDVDEPAAYLRTSVVNRSRSWLRRQRTRRNHRPDPAPVAELGADELWDAMAVLRARERAAIVLRFYEDLPEDEIARVLGCRPTTVRSLVHRGLARLRKEIEP